MIKQTKDKNYQNEKYINSLVFVGIRVNKSFNCSYFDKMQKS